MTTDTQLQPYNLELATIEALKSKYLTVTIPIDDKAAYAMVMSGLRECREIRLAVDAWHKERKEWIVKAGRHYDTEKRRIHSLVEPIEVHLTEVRKIEDDRKEAIKRQKQEQEQARISAIRQKIFDIQKLVASLNGKTAPELQAISEQIFDLQITTKTFQEFTLEAEQVKMQCFDLAIATREARIKQDEEDIKRQAEEEKLRQERERQEAERKRLTEEAVKLEAAKREQEIKEKAEREAREKLEREAKDKKEREEAEEKERLRKAAMAPDKEKLLIYAHLLEVSIQTPPLESETAMMILSDALRGIKGIVAMIRKEVEKLCQQ